MNSFFEYVNRHFTIVENNTHTSTYSILSMKNFSVIIIITVMVIDRYHCCSILAVVAVSPFSKCLLGFSLALVQFAKKCRALLLVYTAISTMSCGMLNLYPEFIFFIKNQEQFPHLLFLCSSTHKKSPKNYAHA